MAAASAFDQDLGERDNDDVDEFPPAERQLTTQSYDLSINTLIEQWHDNTLILPDFQREYVWDNAKASRLVESLLLNIPIPNLYFSETQDAQYEIVDGHQRVFSVVRYIDNRFPLSGLRIQGEFKGLRFHQLPSREQRFLKTRTMRAIIIAVESHPTMKFEIFERLNTGGLALNAQEIRNALYRGPLNDLLKELETHPDFRYCLGSKQPRKRMVDRELVLRFLALRNHLPQYRTPLLRFLNEFMRKNATLGHDQLETFRAQFELAVSTVRQLFGSSAFRVIDAQGDPVERNVNRALFDAQMLACGVRTDGVPAGGTGCVREAVAGLSVQERFADSIRRATGDRSRTLYRIRSLAQVLQSCGIPIDISLLGRVDWPDQSR